VTDEPRLTPASAQAIADKVIESTTIPKKIPHVEDVDGQTKVMVGALSSALMTSTETPMNLPPPAVGALAEQLIAYGWRQTEHIDAEAIYAPAWITDGVRQESIKVPEQPQHTEADPAAERVATAPAPPKRIKAAERAVRL
jgi:hypothetical protein